MPLPAMSSPLRRSFCRFALLALVAAFCACGGKKGGSPAASGSGGSGGNPPAVPGSVTSFQPAQGAWRTKVTLMGTNLDGAFQVWFGATPALILGKTPSSVDVEVPYFPPADLGAKTLQVEYLTTGGLKPPSPVAVPFTVLPLAPVITTALPARPKAGSTVTLFGENLAGIQSVKMGPVDVPFLEFRGFEAQVTLPDPATSGPLTFTTQGGTTTFPLTIAPGPVDPPSITGVVPPSAVPGTTVTLVGTGLGTATQVTFGGVAAASFTPLGTRRLQAVVPAGAPNGPVAVATPQGPALGPTEFVVLAPSTTGPVITAFSPASSGASPIFSITGTGLASVTDYRIGDQVLAGYATSDTRAVAKFRPGQTPVSGPLVLASPLGAATSPGSFTYAPGAPSITALFPGTVGTSDYLTIYGSNLDQATSVQFTGGAAASLLLEKGPTRVRVFVPYGAQTGPVRVLGAGGISGSSPADLQVTATRAPLSLAIDQAYLTQGIQDGTVPLVAGQDAQCRIRVTANRWNNLAPAVRVTLAAADGTLLLQQDLPAPTPGVPEVLDERVAGGWNLPVPGNLVQQGMTLAATLVPSAALPVNVLNYPRTGTSEALNVVPAGDLGICLLPVSWRDASGATVTGNLSPGGAAPDTWLDTIRKIYPPGPMDVAVLPAWDAGVSMTGDPDKDTLTIHKVADRLETKRRLEAGSSGPSAFRFWFGVYPLPKNCGLIGVATEIGAPGTSHYRAGVGYDGSGLPGSDQTYHANMAHEIGHLKGRRHAPCGGAGGPDPFFPFPDCRLGGAAYDLAAGNALDYREYHDIMGYRSPKWVSAYTYKALVAASLADRAAAAALQPLAVQDCLVVSGTLQNGAVSLDPAVELQDYPDTVPAGDWTLQFLDAQGNVLQALPFEPQEAPDTGDVFSFYFSVPYPPALKAALASIQVVQGASPQIRARLSATPSARARAAREPVAVPWTRGRIHVDWDPSAYPMALVRDPRTGSIRATSTTGEAEFESDATELELLLSDGLHTTLRIVKVGNF